MYNLFKKSLVHKLALCFALLITSVSVSAQQAPSPAQPETVWSNPLAISMVLIIFVLLIVIILMGNVVLGTAEWHFKKQKDNGNFLKAVTILLMLGLPSIVSAQDAAATTAAAPLNIGGLSGTTFFMLLAVIAVELVVILVMALFVRSFIAKEKTKVAAVTTETKEEKTFQAFWDKFNSFRPITEESKIDLGHNYDGIRELNNRLPAWWLYGFYGCILFAAIYLWRYHVSHSAPSSREEYTMAMQTGEEQKQAYLAKAANNIDENTVAMISDKDQLDAGKAIFLQVCSACHGKEGQGGVGPNLTDDYWLHGGSIKDIFKTIKYGVVEKGMKSWKDDYSPKQIALLASYIRTLKGTNPPNPKEKQGDLFTESAAPAKDSSAVVKDSAAVKEVKASK
ncbi:MAG: c-type cytochrome [Chitinophagaceae bacterium]|nr:c-type cytochrome [Chitinophagaceae bacterium]